MAKDPENQAPEEAPQVGQQDSGKTASSGGTIRLTGQLAAVLVVALAAGFGLGRLLKGPATAQASEEPAEQPARQEEPKQSDSEEQCEFHEFETIMGNLDEPRMARYVRLTITLAINPGDSAEAKGDIDEQKPKLANWLRTYLAGCTLEDVRGPTNLNRIRREICDRFNDMIWPQQKPLIQEVLFKEFAIQ